jgi:NAD(P)-dependent dehydrogenase (short-subunit alcohol dehydrogenase family)
MASAIQTHSAKPGSNLGVALVTGGTGIIGPGICQELRDAGYTVAAHERDPQKAQHQIRIREKVTQKPFPADGLFFADFSDPSAAEPLVAQVQQKLGPISLVVNNAVTNPARVPLESCSIDYVQHMLNVNVHTPLELARAALDSLKQTQGTVINLSSIAVNWMWAGSLMYSVSKAALEQATRSLALELGRLEIRVNTIRLGSVVNDAELYEDVERLPAELAPRFYQEMIRLRRQTPAGRQALKHGGTPEDVGALIVFLASSKARFITGATIALDGGMDVALATDTVRPDRPIREHIQAWYEANAPHLSNR